MNDDQASSGRRDRDAANSRGTVVALIFVVLLAAVLYWGVQALVRHNAVQNCLDSGRRDCVPAAAP